MPLLFDLIGQIESISISSNTNTNNYKYDYKLKRDELKRNETTK